MPSGISWLRDAAGRPGETWNPITGCTPISAGCDHCYAKRLAETRLRGRCGYDADRPFKPTIHGGVHEAPLHWARPRRVFLCSMGDLFHEQVSYPLIASLWTTMRRARQHQFFILTKRADRLDDFVDWFICEHYGISGDRGYLADFPHLALGVTAENQNCYDARVRHLLAAPAAYRYVSCEPLLEEINLHLDHETICAGLGGVIVGAETGPERRMMDCDWARAMQYFCQLHGKDFFFKQDSQGHEALDGMTYDDLWTPLGGAR
jgi:protein gp37